MENNLFSTFYLQKEHRQLLCTEACVAFIQYKTFRIDLLTGKKIANDVSDFVRSLDAMKIAGNYPEPIVIHLFYEFGHICNELEDIVDETKPLAIYIHYKNAVQKPIINFDTDAKVEFEPLSLPVFKEFKLKFDRVYNNLLAGECYQLNLTMPFYFRMGMDHSPRELLNLMWKHSLKIGAYSHATYIDSLGKLFISNSPECLFQLTKKK